MGILPFPHRRDDRHGVIHVMGDRVSGFEIGHESASGNSWGSFSSYATGEEAIAAAYALNRDTYEGVCDVFVCDAALQDACPGVGLPSVPGDF
ncbi:hypothetical protein [Sphingomonas paucimobilis]|uniref:Uncharacterized protein n=1 Tax=Sphingomonas paucimobilis TaxID=13689 RepID=A0A7Y2KTI2_SPHPI|nr:hypothetical protein [Sphingomonas paucimobilis]NNG59778.1 hypothetical protein [Sphingomonas paucimobilis]